MSVLCIQPGLEVSQRGPFIDPGRPMFFPKVTPFEVGEGGPLFRSLRLGTVGITGVFVAS